MIALAMEMIEEQLHLLQNVQILLNKGENKKSKENGEPKGEEGTDEDPGEADNQLKPATGDKVRKLSLFTWMYSYCNLSPGNKYGSIRRWAKGRKR